MIRYIATALVAGSLLASASPALAISTRSARQDALAYVQQQTALAKVAYPETSYQIAGCARRARAVVDCGIWATNRTGRYYAIDRLTDHGDRFLLQFVRLG